MARLGSDENHEVKFNLRKYIRARACQACPRRGFLFLFLFFACALVATRYLVILMKSQHIILWDTYFPGCMLELQLRKVKLRRWSNRPSSNGKDCFILSCMPFSAALLYLPESPNWDQEHKPECLGRAAWSGCGLSCCLDWKKPSILGVC